MTLAEYGESVMTLATRGLESKTLDPYMAGWGCRVVPSLGHLRVRMITNGAVDRTAYAWISDECLVARRRRHAQPASLRSHCSG
ncbi:hypothetical protein SAMN04489713_11686 [Actinomadura madurae]|uniref:Uncharacterized protein n=1 Tax=Actinomadura madurae TaxID=1993 RepID=A0A1I5S9G0_9ACTN|nr:hypothetical protein SAMN04489713_11686 [Actinomadura madurae]